MIQCIESESLVSFYILLPPREEHKKWAMVRGSIKMLYNFSTGSKEVWGA
jgi:hypothetical protein